MYVESVKFGYNVYIVGKIHPTSKYYILGILAGVLFCILDRFCRSQANGLPDYTDPAVFTVVWSQE